MDLRIEGRGSRQPGRHPLIIGDDLGTAEPAIFASPFPSSVAGSQAILDLPASNCNMPSAILYASLSTFRSGPGVTRVNREDGSGWIWGSLAGQQAARPPPAALGGGGSRSSQATATLVPQPGRVRGLTDPGGDRRDILGPCGGG